MAEAKATQQKIIEKEYVIPLRREWSKVPSYKRTAKSVKAIKEFIVKHMAIRDRDTKKVKLDIYLNRELWFRGRKKPFNKIKVKAYKEGDIVRVKLIEEPDHIKFLRIRQEKIHKKIEKKKEEKPEEKKEGLEEKIEDKTEKEKKEESKEKAKAVEEVRMKAAEQDAKVQKHLAKGKQPQVQRKALKK